MSKVWVTQVPASQIQALRALREAQRYFDPEANATTAQEALDVFKHDGFVFIGESERGEALDALRASLKAQGCETTLDLDPERYARLRAARDLTAAGASPEQVFAQTAGGPAAGANPEPPEEGFSVAAYETALSLMALMDGNPLRACAAASMLGRTTEDGLYRESILALVETFPWLVNALQEQGLMPE